MRVRLPPFAPIPYAGVDNRKPVDRLASKAMILGSASLPSGTILVGAWFARKQ